MKIQLLLRSDPPPFEDENQPWDDEPWEVFIPDDDQLDPLPEVGDFWPDDDGGTADMAISLRQRRESQPCYH